MQVLKILSAMLVLSSISLQAQEAVDPLAKATWLDGIETEFVSEVAFMDIGFTRYQPYRNPYQATHHALAHTPLEKLEHVVMRYGSGLADDIAPFYGRTQPFGAPSSGLGQHAEYNFKSTCASCPDHVSMSYDGLGITFKPKPGERYGDYVSLALGDINAEHFAKYPFLREVLEIHALMLDHTNPKSYVFQREKGLYHGLQAVRNFVFERGLNELLSHYTAKQLNAAADTSLNQRIQSQFEREIKDEMATRDSSLALSSNTDPYPYQSIAGKHVLIRALLNSVFATDNTVWAKARLVMENYRKRRALAKYNSDEFHNNNQWFPRPMGPRPSGAKPYQWWNEIPQWFSSAPPKLPRSGGGGRMACYNIWG